MKPAPKLIIVEVVVGIEEEDKAVDEILIK